MDKYLDARFERVERALATLIDSLSKYNPSEKVAEDLLLADSELVHSLTLLEQHQNNLQRIEALRQETSTLDAQTKEIIGSLWTMRKEVKNTQTTSYPAAGPKFQFTATELLNYARRVSRNTLPPPGVTNGVDLGAPAGGTGTVSVVVASPVQQDDEAGRSQTQTPNASFNGVAASAAATPSANGEVMGMYYQPNKSRLVAGSWLILGIASQATVTSSATELPIHLKPVVNMREGAVFYPWPIEESIRSGALAGFQQLADRGTDPRGFDPEEEEQRKRDEEQARKEAEEQARLEREEADRRMREERERMAREREEAHRRGSVAVGSSQGGQKSQFTFLDGLDDDDDDE